MSKAWSKITEGTFDQNIKNHNHQGLADRHLRRKIQIHF